MGLWKGFPQSFLNAEIEAVQTINTRDSLAYKGLLWTSRRILTIPAGVSNLFFDPTPAVANNVAVIPIPPSFVGIGDDAIHITVYGGATYTGGTNQIISNRNQNILSSSLSIINYGGTLVTPGIEGQQFLVPTFAQGVFNSSGSSKGDIILVLNTSIVTRLKIDNKSLTSSKLEYTMIWAEIT